MKAKELLVILLFCLVLRGLSTCALNYFFHEGDNEITRYYLGLLCNAAMYILLLGLCAHHCGLSGSKIFQIIGPSQSWRNACLAMAFGATLFMFAIGENSLETWIFAQFDETFAYGISSFYTTTGQTSAYANVFEYLAFLSIGVLVAPASEEFFFRGLLFRALSHRMSCFSAALLSSCIFTALHYKHLHVVSTLAFAMSICYIYRATGSLILCATIHSAFNFVALNSENLFGGVLLRAPQDIRVFFAWLPYFTILIISLAIITWVFVYRKHIFGEQRISRSDFLAIPS
jgi:membrane protease YdiL (CAAX protease family)